MAFPTTNNIDGRYFRTITNDLFIYKDSPGRWIKVIDEKKELESVLSSSINFRENRKYFKETFTYYFPTDELYQLAILDNEVGGNYVIVLDQSIPDASNNGTPDSGTVAIYEIESNGNRNLLGSFYNGSNSDTPIGEMGLVALDDYGASIKIPTGNVSDDSVIEITYITTPPKEESGIEATAKFIAGPGQSNILSIFGDREIRIDFDGTEDFFVMVDGSQVEVIRTDVQRIHTVSLFIERISSNYEINVLVNDEDAVNISASVGDAMLHFVSTNSLTPIQELATNFGNRVYIHELIKGYGYDTAYKNLQIRKKLSHIEYVDVTSDDVELIDPNCSTIIITDGDNDVILPDDMYYSYYVINQSGDDVMCRTHIADGAVIPSNSVMTIIFNGETYVSHFNQKLNTTDNVSFNRVAIDEQINFPQTTISYDDQSNILTISGTATISVDSNTIFNEELEIDEITVGSKINFENTSKNLLYNTENNRFELIEEGEDSTLFLGNLISSDIKANDIEANNLEVTASAILNNVNINGTVGNTTNNRVITQALRPDTHNTRDVGITGTRYKDGYFSGQVNAGSFNSSSSKKLKENIKYYEEKGLDIIKQLEIVTFNFKNDVEKRKHIGIIAENSPKEILSNDGKALSTTDSIGVLFKAVQEIFIELEEIKKKVE